jgi:hypothetical protein
MDEMDGMDDMDVPQITTSNRQLTTDNGLFAASPCRRVAVSPCRRVAVSPRHRVSRAPLESGGYRLRVRRSVTFTFVFTTIQHKAAPR